MPGRRFPALWSVEDIDAAFVVRDQNGQGPRWFEVELNQMGNTALAHAEAHMVGFGALQFNLIKYEVAR
jgi:hypothetical protein